MNALMICLLASAAATVGSRWWLLSIAALHQLGPWRGGSAVAATAMLGATLSAAFGMTLASQFRGPAMLLLIAMALAFAAAGLAWPVKPLSARLRGSLRGTASGTILLCAAMISDGAPFIILSVAAWTGSGMLSAAGGATGLIACAAGGWMVMQNSITLPNWLHWLRLTLAGLLAVAAGVSAISALGIG